MKPTIEERAKELQENLKYLNIEAQEVVDLSRNFSNKWGIYIFLGLVKHKDGTVSGPYWQKGKRVKFRRGKGRRQYPVKGESYFTKNLTRAKLWQVKKIRVENVEKMMEFNETAKYLRGMRLALTKIKTGVARALQARNELYIEMFGNYRNEKFSALRKQIKSLKYKTKKQKTKKGGK